MKPQLEKEYIIDVDVVIESYNAKNPTLKKMDRTMLAELLGVNKQILSDWKNGKTPKLIYKILKLMEIGEIDFSEFIKEK